jgi:integrase/recombinase XerD
LQDVRDVSAIKLAQWGRVSRVDESVPWLVMSADGTPVEPVRRFLVDFIAQGNSDKSVRSYCFDLLRWWRWLRAVDVEWDKATPAEVRDLVLWMKQATKPRRWQRTISAANAGTVNPLTQKRNLGDQYGPRTIRHSNAVLRTFYDFWIDIGEGPLLNPVQLKRRGNRAHAHHNPLEVFRAEGRIRYNPKVPKRSPRAMPDQRWTELFTALTSNRDRAILALGVSTAARASELLGLRPVDLDWGDQLIRVVRKGTRAEQWLPASPEAFVWIRLYLADLGEPFDPNMPLWWTLRRRDRGAGLARQPLDYEALRAVFRRANALLGTNWTMHDLRHTSALRMSRDPGLQLTDVQKILGHAHLSTTGVYLADDTDVIHRVAAHLAERAERVQRPTPAVAAGYDSAALSVLFGGEPQ